MNCEDVFLKSFCLWILCYNKSNGHFIVSARYLAPLIPLVKVHMIGPRLLHDRGDKIEKKNP